METIVALALRNADRWIEDLRREAARRTRRSRRAANVVETKRFGR
jgi:hypothetical protein